MKCFNEYNYYKENFSFILGYVIILLSFILIVLLKE
jgi:hypothetical protein